jgi:hypothetical protein
MHQSIVRSAGALAACGCYRGYFQRRSLPFVRRFSSQRAAATGAAFPHAPSSVNFVSPAVAATVVPRLHNAIAIKIDRLVFDEAFFGHLLVAEPQIGDIRGAQAVNILKCAAHFLELEVYAQPLQQIK